MQTSIASWALLASTVLAAACGSDTPTTPGAGDTAAILGSAGVAPQAIVMAAGKTLQLTVAATSLAGTALSDLDGVTFTSSDSTKVKVSASGLLTAQTGPNALTQGPIAVTVAVTRHGVTKTAMASVVVTETEGTNPVFTVGTPNDPLQKRPVKSTFSVPLSLTYTTPDGPVTLPSYNIPGVLTLAPAGYGSIVYGTAISPLRSSDTLRVSASINVFGTTLTGSTKYPLGDPSSLSLGLSASGLVFKQGDGSVAFTDSTTLYLGAGGTVTFSNSLYNTNYVAGVTFTPSNGGAAVAPITGLTSTTYSGISRTFPVPGTYVYTWTGDAATLLPANQQSSRIIVR